MTTKRSFGEGEVEERTRVDAPMALREPLENDSQMERYLDAGIEVVIVPRSHAPGLDPAHEPPWHYIQLWTAKRIYAIDMAMRCVGVYDRATGAPDERHVLLGGRLTGGQHAQGGTLKMVYPIPVPGTQGVFELSASTGSHGHTSICERVLLRLPAMTVAQRGAKQTWEAIASWEEMARQGHKTERDGG
ncbi:MAG TPA: hypothetical protein VGQ83_39470 [Polyangia bacterium]|jgi:hypothetical protein